MKNEVLPEIGWQVMHVYIYIYIICTSTNHLYDLLQIYLSKKIHR